MKIPYGMSNFGDIRREGFFYVDKTPFIPLLESGESGYRYVVLLRPRRIGKSLLLSMLEHYYDLRHAEEHDALFGGLWIHANPTPERGRYLVLTLDFSTVKTDSGREALERTFFAAVKAQVISLLLRYRARIPTLGWLFEHLGEHLDAEALLGTLMGIVEAEGHRLYVLIDEYDTFANNLLSAGQQDLYESLTEHTGFVRSFYRTLKSGTQSGAIGRLFITGVSPLMLDDMASGFNIATHISQDPRFNTLAGFTRADVERAVDESRAARPALAADPRLGDRAALLSVLERYYDGYRFSEDAEERMFNSDMVLYFLRELENKGRYPAQMLDMNIRIDYSRLQRLAALTGATGGRLRAIMEEILTDGSTVSRLSQQFGVRSLSSQEQYLSLLFYLGLLTIGSSEAGVEGLRLEIPNRVIRELQWEHLAMLLQDELHYELDTEDLAAALRSMAAQGDIAPFLELFHGRVVKAMGLKDLRQLGEKSLKLMLLTFVSLSRVFHPLSEKELNQGYCDLFLGVSPTALGARYAWMLELKYLPTDAQPAQLEAAFAEAEQQLARYASDPHLVPLLTQGRELKAGSLVFVGAQAYHFRPFDRAPAAAPDAG